MKKLFIILIILLSVIACKKTKFSPEGPTDVRIKNLSTSTFTEVIVNTSGGIDTLASVSPGGVSAYSRFTKAFNVAEVTVKINGNLYTTGSVNYNGLTYIGQAKITYEVYIIDDVNRKLKISNCSLDAPLD